MCARLWRVCASLFVLLCLGLAQIAAGAQVDPSQKPNVVLILTDDMAASDMRWNDERAMPYTKKLLAERGMTFTNAFASYSWCCPFRATMLLGQYAHNHEIFSNGPPHGGGPKFIARGHDKRTFAVWLQEAGIKTALVGKILNHYLLKTFGTLPGWSYVAMVDNAHTSYDYDLLTHDDGLLHYGNKPKDYLNDVLTRYAMEFLRQAAAEPEPFFLYVGTSNPHSPTIAAPRHIGLHQNAVLPRSPAFNEADRSDKPALIRSLPPLNDAQIDELTVEYRRRLDSLAAVDEMVRDIVETLEVTGELDNTYIIFTSDNGFHLGEHGLIAGKNTAYTTDTRIPLIVRGPGISAGAVSDALIVNTDFAPTFAEVAGLTFPSSVDGRSFLPLLIDRDATWTRQSVLLERRIPEEQLFRQASAAGIAMQEVEQAGRFNGLMTKEWLYVEYLDTGERELYELAADPHQLNNVAKDAGPAFLAMLSGRVAALASCAGAECRRIEDLPIGLDGRQVSMQKQPAAQASIKDLKTAPDRTAASSGPIVPVKIP
jgi:arylsulfatase A-like enzyme